MKKTFIAAIAAAMLSVSSVVSAGKVEFGNWTANSGDHSGTERFYLASTMSVDSDLYLNIIYSTSLDCRPGFRVLFTAEESANMPNQLDYIPDGMLVKVDGKDVWEFPRGMISQQDDVMMIMVKPSSELMIDLVKGRTLIVRVGQNKLGKFSLAGSERANTAAISACLDDLEKMSSPEADHNYFK